MLNLTLEKKDLIVLIIVAVLLLILFVVLIINLYLKHKSHSLYYHKYNSYLLKHEKKFKMSFDDKLITFRNSPRVSHNDLFKNINNLSTINANCIDLINSQAKHKKKRQKDILFDLNALQSLPKLIDTRLYKSARNPQLLKSIFTVLFIQKHLPIIDKIILKSFGNSNYFVFKKSIFYLFNDRMIEFKINKNKLIEPIMYLYDDLKINMVHKIGGLTRYKYDITISCNDEIIINKRIICSRLKYKSYDSIITLLDSIDMYRNCQTIADALKKHQHIEKMNENTLIKIESMSGRKFITWVQSALKSIYKTDVELKVDEKYGLYLRMMESSVHKSVVISVKRHQDKINSSQIKNLKLLQEKENTSEAWIITTSEYTNVSINLAKNLDIRLIDKSELEHIVNKYNSNFYQNF